MIVKKIAKEFKGFYKDLMFDLSSKNNSLYIGFYKYLYKPSKGSLSHFLDEYSKSNKGLTVVQVGANDGFNHDPIHKFVKRDKWKGVLIEPQKYIFENFLYKLHQHTDEVVPLNAAMGEEDGEMPLYKISFTNERWATGLATFHKPTLENAVKNGTIKRRALKNGVTPPASEADYISEEMVAVVSPGTLRTQYHIDHLDLLMVDTEGYDFEIIKMFVGAEMIPDVMVFEYNHLSEVDLESCKDFLKDRDYSFVVKGTNMLAVKQGTGAAAIYKPGIVIR
ncbi:MAG: FkbM family methyltransferase, partial [Cyclobacteriaceae bacterium]